MHDPDWVAEAFTLSSCKYNANEVHIANRSLSKTDCSETEAKSGENVEATPSVPVSDYAKKLDQRVKKRYEDKIAAIRIDPVLLEGKHFEPDCLPPVEATDLLSHCYGTDFVDTASAF